MAERKQENLRLKELAREVQLGNKTHEQEFYHQLTKYTHSVFVSRLGQVNEYILTELVSNTVSSILESLVSWEEGKGTFTTWINRIINNKVVDYVRWYRKEMNHIEDQSVEDIFAAHTPKDIFKDEVLDKVVEKELEKAVLAELLQHIEPVDRTIYLLRLNYDLTFQDLAEITQKAGYDLTTKAVEERFYRTRNKLRSAIQRALQ